MIPRLPKGFSHPMRIGEGAFASVYRVRQEALERWVALKFIYEKNPVKRRELLKEAQTQAKLRTDCVPLIYDAFEWRSSVCMIMEFISGISLATALELNLSIEDRLSIAGCFIAALAEIHQLGFVHRDLKPENIIIAPQRGLFLVDFGFSKHIAEAFISTIAHAKGTPAYMAPELWNQGGKADLMRADIFASGKILQLVLAGTLASDFTAVLIREDPRERPASALHLREMWKRSPWYRHETPDWQRIAGDLTAQRLSNDLFHAAQQLLHARRADEAYWLLVESIEKNGSNHEALEFMSGFQDRTRKRPAVVHVAVVSAVICGGLLSAYLAGKRSNESVGWEPVSMRRQHAVLLTPAGGDRGPIGHIALREDPLRSDKLSGKLLLRHKPSAPVLRIDGRPVDRDTVCGNGLQLHYGEHDLAIYDSAGRMLRQKTIAILPFQTKVIDLSMPDSVPKGN